MLFQLFALIFALTVSGLRDLTYNDVRMKLHERRRTPGFKWVPRRRQNDAMNQPLDASLVDDLLNYKAEVEPAAWDHLVNPDANPASNAGDEEPEVAYALGDILAGLADKIQNLLANLDVDALVAQIQGTIANVAEIIQNVADSIVDLTEAIVANIGDLTEVINQITAAVEQAIQAIQAATGRRRQMTEDEEFFTKLDSLDGRMLNNVMDSDLDTIQQTNNFGPLEMQDLNNMQDHVGATAAALNLNADDLADLINNISDQVQQAIATVLDQLANLQDIIANIANAAGLQTADLEVIATANMEDMAATGELTEAEMIDLNNIQNALNGALGDINLDALAGLTPDAIADLANLDLANIQDALNLPNAADLEDLIANIKDQVPDVAAALDELANLKDAVANLDLGLNVAELQAVNLADLTEQANLNVLTDLEIADLGALQDVLDQVANKVDLANLPDGLNIVNLEEISNLAGAQLQMVTAELNLPNVDAGAIQNVLDDIAQINFDIADLGDVLAALQGQLGATAADLTFLQMKDTSALEIHMEPQMAQMVQDTQSTLEQLWNKGLDIDVLPDGVTDDDLERLNRMSQASLNQVIAGLQSMPDIYQLRSMMTAAEEQPATQPVTTSRPLTTQRPANNGNQNKGGATRPARQPTNQAPGNTQPQNPAPTNTGSTDMTGMNGSTDMTGMNGNNGGMDGMSGGMGGMDGHNHGMEGHDHTKEEPPIYSNPMVLGAAVVIVLGLAFLAYKKCSNKPKQDESLLASEVQRSNIPTYAQQPLTV